MRKLLLLLIVLFSVSTAHAQTVENDLVGLGMPPEQASYLASILPAGSVVGNNTFIKGRNQANSADINILKVDATDDTVLTGIVELKQSQHQQVHNEAVNSGVFTTISL